eukprot:TRINITY_DN31555_c0_g1_i3.p1 TRINITY_DN31555_c0_g1~~TRINITY_DN31555_c0_g1_i3.p1  ORF type:complete len:101 (+),score=11.77 TRINITY_DN31555_c0_g1_i3:238-540(+)
MTAPLHSENFRLKSMPSCFITMQAPHVSEDDTSIVQMIQYQSLMVTTKKLVTCRRSSGVNLRLAIYHKAHPSTTFPRMTQTIFKMPDETSSSERSSSMYA